MISLRLHWLFLVAIAAMVPVPVSHTPPRLRAFWVDAFNAGIKREAHIRQLVDDAASANLNALIVQVRRRGDAYYLSGVEPRAQDAALDPLPYDPLRTLLDAAHARGIQVHAWVATLAIWKTDLGAPPAGHVLGSHGPGAPGENWVMYSFNGASSDSENNIWLDPGHPEVVAYTESVMRDLLARYPDLDGLHLDRVRYPDREFGYNPTAVARFNARYDWSGAPDPDDPLWSDWRREQVTALVRRIALAVAELSPRGRLSAATIAWGDGPDQVGGWEQSAPYVQVFQDWRGWLQEGLLDTAVVMNYDREYVEAQRAFFDHWLAWETTRAGGPVVVGPAAYLNSVEGTLAQIARAQESQAIGVALYSYAATNRDGQPRAVLLDALRGGPFAAPAAVPAMPWKEERGALEGSLEGVVHLQSRDGVSVILDGPERRVLVSDGAGWFGATRLAPGDYTAMLLLGSDRAARASATVAGGAVAHLSNWEVVALTQREYVPHITR